MPRIFDNIDQQLLPALKQTLSLSERGDFCVGYFNLRGWKQIDRCIEQWSGRDGHCCRLLVGMQRLPQEDLRAALALSHNPDGIDTQTVVRLRRALAEEFRNQLMLGAPTNEDEAGLRRLAAQIRAGKVVVKLFLRHPLHAKLYLLFRPDPINPAIGYVGSSNLTFAGLALQGELNVDVLDEDACQKLARWFEARWNDRWCFDISEDLVRIIDESWAREELIPPHHIYVKMAYHLCQDVREGLAEFRIPKEFGKKLFKFQAAAVKIAAHHVNRRGGVLLGDVVGLGKTLMASALAKILEDDQGLETLILCPRNLVKMWEDYRDQYRLHARVLPYTRAISELPHMRRYRLVILDESHNLRNREGRRYRAIYDYIQKNESRCVLLSATPYNKTYTDLSSQLRFFIADDKDLGVRPETLMRNIGQDEFQGRFQCPPRSLAAFEKSPYPDDWRELMRLFMIRRTRSFIKDNYAEVETATGRRFLTFEDGSRSWFPDRIPRTVKFGVDESDGADQYARLYSPDIVAIINALRLPRYGLGNYVVPSPASPPTQAESKVLQDLSRAGRRLMGFSRTNLFKRLESSGYSFLLSVERHILRNFVFLHAIVENLPLPIGPQGSEYLDTRLSDAEEDSSEIDSNISFGRKEADYRSRAAALYTEYSGVFKSRFTWINSSLFVPTLKRDLYADALQLLKITERCPEWRADLDSKLQALRDLVERRHPAEKVLLFTQFADTARYLEEQIRNAGVGSAASATGDSEDPTALAWRFSPESNGKRDQIPPERELRVLLATDVLSEGQNLQDCSIVVNYDLPWAIIRLIQRAGRVDRIGQTAQRIICYSFLPADGVERLIRLRNRVRQRLTENAEVVGSDEAFFEDDRNDNTILDLYNEKAGILDDDRDGEVDLASYAYQIWKDAVERNPELQKSIPEMPAVVYSTRDHHPTANSPGGVLVYVRTADANDALAWMDANGRPVTESQLAILRAAECAAGAPALARLDAHHALVAKAAEWIAEQEKSVGGSLGRRTGARFKTYERLKHFLADAEGTLFDTSELRRAIDEIYKYPLHDSAADALGRQLRSGVSDVTLAQLVTTLREEDRLCVVQDDARSREPKIICSMGLRESSAA